MADSSLIRLLKEAFPCQNFKKTCRDHMKWIPERGYVPSGFGGANGSLDDVQLVIITAEPSTPLKDDTYAGSPKKMISKELSLFEKYMRGHVADNKSRYFPNLKEILDNFFGPNRSLDDKLKSTWFTTSVKCAAERTGGPVKRNIEIACTDLYLKRELGLLPNAFVLALGGKARDRLKRVGIYVNAWAHHPSARNPIKREASWQAAATCFRKWLRERRV
jgi:hypothetical protein